MSRITNIDDSLKKSLEEDISMDYQMADAMETDPRGYRSDMNGRIPLEQGGDFLSAELLAMDREMTDSDRLAMNKKIKEYSVANPTTDYNDIYTATAAEVMVPPEKMDKMAARMEKVHKERSEAKRLIKLPFSGLKEKFTSQVKGVQTKLEGNAAELRKVNNSVSDFNKVEQNIMNQETSKGMFFRRRSELMNEGVPRKEAHHRAILETAEAVAEGHDAAAEIFKTAAEFEAYQVAAEDQPVGTFEQVLFEGGKVPLTLVQYMMPGGAVVGPLSTYTEIKGSIAKSIDAGLANNTKMTPDEKKLVKDLASDLGAAVSAPMEVVSNLFQISRIMGRGPFSKLLAGVFGASLGEGATEYLQQYPEEVAVIWALNPILSMEELKAEIIKKLPEIHEGGVEAAKVGAIVGGATVGVGGTINLSYDDYISDKQRAYNETVEANDILIISSKNKGKKLTKRQKKALKAVKDAAGTNPNVDYEDLAAQAHEERKLLEYGNDIKSGKLPPEEIEAIRQKTLQAVKEVSSGAVNSRKGFEKSLDAFPLTNEDKAVTMEFFDSLAQSLTDKGDLNNVNELYDFWFTQASQIKTKEGFLEAQLQKNDYVLLKAAANDPNLDEKTRKQAADKLEGMTQAMNKIIAESDGFVSLADTILSVPRSIRMIDHIAYMNRYKLNKKDAVKKQAKQERKLLKQGFTKEAAAARVTAQPFMTIADRKDFNSKAKITLFHETGHIIQDMMFTYDPAAYAKLAAHYGENPAAHWSSWNREKSVEKFVQEFEEFISNGKAPNKQMESVFTKMKSMYDAIAKFFRDHLLNQFKQTHGDMNAKLSPEVEQILNEFISGDIGTQEVQAGQPAEKGTSESSFPDLLYKSSFTDFQNQADQLLDQRKEMAGIVDDPTVPITETVAQESGVAGPNFPEHVTNWNRINSADTLNSVQTTISQSIDTLVNQAIPFFNAATPEARAEFTAGLDEVMPGFGQHVSDVAAGQVPEGTYVALGQEVGLHRNVVGNLDANDAMAARIMFNEKFDTLKDIAENRVKNRKLTPDQRAMMKDAWAKEKWQFYAMKEAIHQPPAKINEMLAPLKLPAEMSPEAQLKAFEDGIRQIKSRRLSQNLFSRDARMYLKAYAKGKPANNLDAMFPVGLADMVYEMRVNGMLSALGTLGINLVGTAANTAIDPVERIFFGAPASRIKSIVDKALGREVIDPNNEIVTLDEGITELTNMFAGIKDAWSALRSGEFGFDTPTSRKKGGADRNSITAEAMRRTWPGKAMNWGWNKAMGREFSFPGVDAFGKFVRVPTNLLNMSDRIFTDYIAYRGLLHALAKRKAYNEAQQDPTVNVEERYQEILAHPEQHELDSQSIDSKAIEDAYRLAFKGQVTGAGQKVIGALNAVPGLRWIVPFKNTPYNIAKILPMRTPVMRRFTDEYQQSTGADRAVMDAKVAMGVTTMAVIMSMLYFDEPESLDEDGDVKLPRITGDIPTNPTLRKQYKQLGLQPNSLRIGQRYVNLERFEPISTPFLFSAQVMETAELMNKAYNGSPPEELEKELAMIAMMGAISIGNKATNDLFINDLFEFTDMIRDIQTIKEEDFQYESVRNTRVHQYALDMLASTLPYSNLLRTTAKATDPYMRETNTALERLQSKIPGARNSLYPSRNFWGEPTLYADPAWVRFSMPFYTNRVNLDPVDIEVYRLTKMGHTVRAANPRHVMSFNGVEQRLNSAQYDDYMKLLNGMDDDESPSLLKEKIGERIDSKRYQEADDHERKLLINKVINKAEATAKKTLLVFYPELADNVADKQYELELEIQDQRDKRRF